MKNWQQVAMMGAIVVASASLSQTTVHAQDENAPKSEVPVVFSSEQTSNQQTTDSNGSDDQQETSTDTSSLEKQEEMQTQPSQVASAESSSKLTEQSSGETGEKDSDLTEKVDDVATDRTSESTEVSETVGQQDKADDFSYNESLSDNNSENLSLNSNNSEEIPAAMTEETTNSHADEITEDYANADSLEEPENKDYESEDISNNSILAESDNTEIDTSTDGWKQGSNGDYYYVKDGSLLTNSTLEYSGYTYGFDYSGKMIKDQVFNFWHYNEATQKNEHALYRFDSNGHAIKGWYQDPNFDQKWYYYDPTTGKAVSGLQTVDGKEYYFNWDGSELKNGTATDNENHTLYIADENGTVTDKISLAADGWKQGSNGDYYYVKDGSLLTNSTLEYGGYIYGFDYYGKMIKDQVFNFEHYNKATQKYEDAWYRFDSNGHAIKGWYQNPNFDQKWYYYDPATGKAVSGLQTVDGKEYYFNYNGSELKNGTATDNENHTLYIADENGTVTDKISLAADGWKQGSNGDYYYVKDGSLLTNSTLEYGGYTYGFDYYGKMIKDQVFNFGYYNEATQKYEDARYRFDSNGHIIKGWYEVPNSDQTWCYYDLTTGKAANGLQTVDGKEYYFNWDGSELKNGTATDNENHTLYIADENGTVTDKISLAADGWKQASNGDYYYAKDGALLTNSTLEDGGYTYGFDHYGKMIKDQLYDFGHYNEATQKYEDAWYRFDSNGHVIKGWYQDPSQNWYYCDPTTGKAANGLQNINGNYYYFNNSGYLCTNHTFDIENDSSGLVRIKVNSDGVVIDSLSINQDGWQKFDGRWYIVENHSIVKNRWVQSEASWYYMGADGADVLSFQTIDGCNYYFDDGVMLTGWKHVNNNDWIYADEKGHLVDGYTVIAGNGYLFKNNYMLSGEKGIDKDGTLYSTDLNGKATVQYPNDGWQSIEGNYYWFQNGKAQSGWIDVNGTWYYLESSDSDYSNYRMVSNTVLTINGKKYMFDSDGAMFKNRLLSDWFYDGSESYFAKVYLSADGSVFDDGWLKIGNDWYYFDESGKAVTGTNYLSKEGTYSDFTIEGVWKGYITPKNGWYMNPYTSQYYYFDESGNMLKDTDYAINGNDYHFNDRGVMLSDTQFDQKYYAATGAELKNSWRQDNYGRWFYYDSNGYEKEYSFLILNGSKYFFDPHGVMKTDTFIYGNKLYSVDTSSGAVTSESNLTAGWILADSQYYYYNGNQLYKNGIYNIGGVNYCFNYNGEMLSDNSYSDNRNNSYYFKLDGTQLINGWYLSPKMGAWYYADEKGYLVNGLNTIDGTKYMFDYYQMTTFDILGNDYKTVYIIDKSGKVTKEINADSDGWKLIDNSWYYVQNGSFVYAQWLDVNGTRYAIGYDGKMITDGFLETRNGFAWIKSDGTRVTDITGWYHARNIYYYLQDGYVKSGDVSVNGKRYFVDQNGFVDGEEAFIADNTGLYYYDGYGNRSDVILHDGWNQIGSDWIYVGNGRMLTGVQYVNGVRYVFSSSGFLSYNILYNEYRGEEINIYVNSDGSLATGWKQISDKWYYFDSNGIGVDGFKFVDGRLSKFSNGMWLGYM